MNKEIEDLKKKLEELEKASLNSTKNLSEEEKEKIIPKEEREEVINKGIDFDGEIRKATPSEEKGGSFKKVLGIVFLMILTSIAALTIYTTKEKNTSHSQESVEEVDDGLSNLEDIERGFVVMNDYRVWFDDSLYEKNQRDKSICFKFHHPDGENEALVCPATKKDIQVAKDKGTYLYDPDINFEN